MAIETKIEVNRLIITCVLEKPIPSASGKTLVGASTRGNMKTSLMIGGKSLTIGLNPISQNSLIQHEMNRQRTKE
jgi:hypothetical protein